MIVTKSQGFHRLDLIRPVQGISNITARPVNENPNNRSHCLWLVLSAAWTVFLGFELFRLIEPMLARPLL